MIAKLLRLSIVIGVVTGAGPIVQAGAIAIIDPSFEDVNAVTNAGQQWTSTNATTGWVTGNGGTQDPTSNNFGGTAPDGSRVAFTQGKNLLIQDVGKVILAPQQQFELAVYVGARNDGTPFGSYQLKLAYGTTDFSTTTVFATVIPNQTPDPGKYILVTLHGLAPTAAVGKELWVELEGSVQTVGQKLTSNLWDNVRLNTFPPSGPNVAVPEPGTLAIVAFGSVLAVSLRLRRRR
ncbi:MAG: PEP-CTERM sorting domain-containing protein [Planctomycetes bacterium]|nr:PEP-CTERM sorting domain-containing protein [Planctomycetota bacterium]